MKTLKTYSLNELKGIACVNFHRMRELLDAKSFQPVMTLQHGKREVNYYGEDAFTYAHSVGDPKRDRKVTRKFKLQVKAARIAMGLPVGRGVQYLNMPTQEDLQQYLNPQLPLDTPVSRPAPKPVDIDRAHDRTWLKEEPTVNKVVDQLARIASALERLATAWEARPTQKNNNV